MGELFIEIEHGISLVNTEIGAGFLCQGKINFDACSKEYSEDDFSTAIRFEGTLLYPNALWIGGHFCKMFSKCKFVQGTMTFVDKVEEGYFDNKLVCGETRNTNDGTCIKVSEQNIVDTMLHARRLIRNELARNNMADINLNMDIMQFIDMLRMGAQQ